ncbi:MAG: hypothetical protein IKJ55_07025 [Clostridia bacterium]|nr:hypothetical protein [Clostridia bacterium]
MGRDRLSKTVRWTVLSGQGAAVETQKRKFLSFRVTARGTMYAEALKRVGSMEAVIRPILN